MLKSCLSNRRKFTFVQNTTSKFNNITCGAPKGSTRWSIIFIIHVNGFPKYSLFSGKLYADDTFMFST